jgi:hypothetical protein
MNPQDNPNGTPGANADAQDDPLTSAGNDSTENFWFNDAGSSVVGCGSIPPPTVLSPQKKHWVEIALMDEDGHPVPDQNYAITLPGGKVVEGTLNAKGRARVNGIDPGTCKITFPDFHQDSWEPR